MNEDLDKTRLPAPFLPWRLFSLIVAVTFLAEVLVMFLLWSAFPKFNGFVEALIDATLLSFLSAPLLWCLIVKPLQRAATLERLEAARVVEKSVDAIFLVSADGLIQTANPAVERMFGWSAGEIQRQPLVKLLLPSAAGWPEQLFGSTRPRCGTKAVDRILEATGRRRDGSSFTLEVSLSETAPAGGDLFTLIARDITKRKQIETALRESASMFRGLADTCPAGILIQSGSTFRYVNKALEKDSGYAQDELLKMNFWQLAHPDFRELVRERGLARLRGEPTPESYEIKILSKNGKEHWEEVRATRIEFEGAPAILATAFDVTQRKEREAEIQRNYQLQHALNSVLHLSLEPISLDEFLERTLALLLCIPWLCLESRGAIFLVEDEADMLVMRCHQNLPEPTQQACAKILFSKCLCGLAALKQEIQYPGITPHGHYCVPIVFAGRTLGVIALYVKEKHQQQPDEGPFLTGVASILAGIIKRRQMEAALQGSESRYRALAEAAPDMIFVIDRSDRVDYVNSIAARQLNRSPEQIVGTPHEALFPPEVAQQQQRSLQQVFETGEPMSVESKTVFPRGEAWLDTRLVPLRDDQGNVNAIMGIARDITARREFEEALRRSEEFSRSVIESSLDMIITTDLNRRITLFNRAAQGAFGYLESEVLGQSVELLYAEKDEFHSLYRALLATGRCVKETRNRRKNGEVFHSLLAAALLRDDQDQVLGQIGISRDITEHKRAEQRIRMQANLLDLASDAIMVWDLEDRIEFWNQGAERLYGWTQAEAINHSSVALLYQDHACFNEAVALVQKNGEWTGELTHRTKTEGLVVVSARWTLVPDESGSPRSTLAIHTDITEKKELEAKCLRSQRLESLGTLASGVAHDLNNILAPILMSAEILRFEETDAKTLRIADRIETSARRGSNIVKQVLAFARGVTGERVPVQLRHILKDVAKMAWETFPRSITVRIQAPSDLWLVTGDSTQLHQVLVNLTINARDAMPQGGVLTLEAERRELDEPFASKNPGAKPGPHVVFRVRDTGCGIPEHELERIFDPFFTTKPQGKGTGLGLSTVLGIVRNHGGFVTVDSEVGRGSTFQVYLPATGDSVAAPQEEAAPALPRGQGETILVVDDEALIRETTRAALETYGYTVLTAADGFEAVDVCAHRAKEIKVVLTDLMMPRMDGLALVHALQGLSPQPQVICATGLGQDEKIEKMKDVGVRIFLKKPYSTDCLITALHELLCETGQPPGAST